MMKKIIITLFLLAIVFVLPAQNEKLRVAVFDPTSSGTNIDEGTKVAVRELISSTFVNTGKYNIVERSLLQQVMKEQKFTNTDVVDESQATELGRLAGANKVVLSVVTLVGGRNMLSIKVIDVKTATVEQQKTKIVSSNDLLDSVEPLTLELLGKKADYTHTATDPTPPEVGNIENNTSRDHSAAGNSAFSSVADESVQGLKNLIHSSCKRPENYKTDEEKFNSLNATRKVGIEKLILSQSKFALEPSSVNDNEISFFLRNRKKLRTMMVAYIPVKVDDALIVFLDGEVIGYGVASMGFHITLPNNISGKHILSLSSMLFTNLNIPIDLSAKKYYLFDWVTNKKIELVN